MDNIWLAFSKCAGDETVTGMILAAAMLLAGSEWGFAEGGEIYLQFGDGQVSGSGGCNRFAGSYTQDGDKLKLGTLAATQMACAIDAVMQKEQQFFQMLAAVHSAEGSHMKLVLRNAQGKDLAVLVRRDWD
jgi:heat shock protein HslJ